MTARWISSGLFGCDVGLDCVCDGAGRGSDWGCARAVAGGLYVFGGEVDYGCRAFCSCGLARGLVVRKRASGAGAGVVVTRKNF